VQIDEQPRITSVLRGVLRQQRPAGQSSERQDERSVGIDHILDGAAGVGRTDRLLQRIPIRNSAILCPATARAPAAAWDVESHCDVEGGPVDARLPATQ